MSGSRDMAETAQQEPTMEEILSSIRKIIADEGGEEVVESRPQEEAVTVTEVADEDFDDLELEVEDSQELLDLTEKLASDVFDLEGDDLEDDSFEEAVAAPEVFTADDPDTDEDVFEAVIPEVPEAPVEDILETAPETVSEVIVSDEDIAAEPSDIPQFDDFEDEVDMAAQLKHQTTAALTDEATVDAAAGSLGKLLSKVEFGEEAGGDKTIEGLVKELLRPMLKEWLDANLPAIVDKHVEREVARIASMAR